MADLATRAAKACVTLMVGSPGVTEAAGHGLTESRDRRRGKSTGFGPRTSAGAPPRTRPIETMLVRVGLAWDSLFWMASRGDSLLPPPFAAPMAALQRKEPAAAAGRTPGQRHQADIQPGGQCRHECQQCGEQLTDGCCWAPADHEGPVLFGPAGSNRPVADGRPGARYLPSPSRRHREAGVPPQLQGAMTSSVGK
jgi:hypothetical protein